MPKETRSAIDSMRQRSKQRASQQKRRPKRRAATNTHIYRYLHSQNPVKLEKTDLRRAIKASLNSGHKLTAVSSKQVGDNGIQENGDGHLRVTTRSLARRRSSSSGLSFQSSSSSQDSQSSNGSSSGQIQQPPSPNGGATNHQPRRHKPVVRRKIYSEADFFHDGIMEYIEYELTMAFMLRRELNGQSRVRL